MKISGRWATVGVLLATIGLYGCDGSATASKPARDHAALTSATPSADAVRSLTEEDRADPRDAPAPQVDGKPMWTANRRFTAQENAQRAFERNGADFNAETVEDFVRIAHAFVENPPKGAQTLTRSNGDRLIYDAASNTFAVASKTGAPRSIFKPRDGAAYWAEQKVREAERSTRQAGRRERRDEAG